MRDAGQAAAVAAAQAPDELVHGVFDVLGTRVRVISTSVGLLRNWSTEYSAFRVRPTRVALRLPGRPAADPGTHQGRDDIVVRVEAHGDSGPPRPTRAWIAVGDVERPWDGQEDLFPPLGASPLSHWVYLHGTVVGRAGQAALLLSVGPGRCSAGRLDTGFGVDTTSLAVATAARGAWLLSDGLAPLDPDDLLVAPYPRALHLRRETLALLSIDPADPALVPFRTPAGAIEWRAAPDVLLGSRLSLVAADVGAIVVLEPGANGARPKLDRLPPGRALPHLADHLHRAARCPAAADGEAGPDAAMQALTRLCGRVPAYRVAAGEPWLTARLLDEALLS